MIRSGIQTATPPSRSLTVVVPEHAAETLSTGYFAFSRGSKFVRFNQTIGDTLMIVLSILVPAKHTKKLSTFLTQFRELENTKKHSGTSSHRKMGNQHLVGHTPTIFGMVSQELTQFAWVSSNQEACCTSAKRIVSSDAHTRPTSRGRKARLCRGTFDVWHICHVSIQ